MNTKPIIFSGPMVRALLAGNKTQTRRIMKPQPDDDARITMGEIGTSRGVAYIGNAMSGGIVTRVPCPYGKPGDYLWVRESWADAADASARAFDCGTFWPQYRATSHESLVTRWRPSIHMPRWASRLTLHITDVRVERLQEINEEDSKAEGVESRAYPAADGGWIAYDDGKWADGFAALWESIHGAGSWNQNPWVWVISFRVIKQNIDDVLKAAA